MIIDSHCHLDYEPLKNNLDQVLKRANDSNVKYFLTICTENNSFKKIIEILQKYKNVYGTYGIHPHEAKDYKNLTSNEIIEDYFAIPEGNYPTTQSVIEAIVAEFDLIFTS